MRVFRHRDYRLLWIGAFLSFTGSSIQSYAQGWFIYELTHDKSKLALVAFFAALPVAIVGPAAGTIADLLNKRVVLTLCQIMFASCAIFLAYATYAGIVQYWHIALVAGLAGLIGAIEMPTRQSIVSQVVPMDELHQAVPMQAMTFNFGRILGNSLGGVILFVFGVATCYLVNGLSFLALIFSALAIRADLRPTKREPQPIRDLITEGALYTLRNSRLRVLFILECVVAAIAMQYIIQLPAMAKDLWHVGKLGLAWATVMVGVGAIIGLITVSQMPRLRSRIDAIRISIMAMGAALVLLGLTRSVYPALLLIGIAGMSQVVQFNTTNTLFQLLSPPHLRGRVLSMHVWAMAGLSPMGGLFFGWLAQRAGLPVALMSGGACVLACGLWGWSQNNALALDAVSEDSASAAGAVP